MPIGNNMFQWLFHGKSNRYGSRVHTEFRNPTIIMPIKMENGTSVVY